MQQLVISGMQESTKSKQQDDKLSHAKLRTPWINNCRCACEIENEARWLEEPVLLLSAVTVAGGTVR